MRAIVFDPDAPRKFGFADAPDPVPAAPENVAVTRIRSTTKLRLPCRSPV
jgi:hypothetical protein